MRPPVAAKILPLSDKLSPNTNKWVNGPVWAEVEPAPLAINTASIAAVVNRLDVCMPAATSGSDPAA